MLPVTMNVLADTALTLMLPPAAPADAAPCAAAGAAPYALASAARAPLVPGCGDAISGYGAGESSRCMKHHSVPGSEPLAPLPEF